MGVGIRGKIIYSSALIESKESEASAPFLLGVGTKLSQLLAQAPQKQGREESKGLDLQGSCLPQGRLMEDFQQNGF